MLAKRIFYCYFFPACELKNVGAFTSAESFRVKKLIFAVTIIVHVLLMCFTVTKHNF